MAESTPWRTARSVPCPASSPQAMQTYRPQATRLSGRAPDGTDAFRTAVHCLLCTQTYPACVQRAARLGGRPAAAAAGSLAGIAYGEAGIPAQWRMCIPLRGEMDSLCAKMYAFCALYA